MYENEEEESDPPVAVFNLTRVPQSYNQIDEDLIKMETIEPVQEITTSPPTAKLEEETPLLIGEPPGKISLDIFFEKSFCKRLKDARETKDNSDYADLFPPSYFLQRAEVCEN